MLEDLLKKLQSEAETYSLDAVKNPGPVDRLVFKAGVDHGYVKALSHVEQWIQEMLEDEEDDDGK